MPHTILVVDDDAEIAGLMRDFLEAEGFETRIAADGKQALAMIGPDIDLVLLDVMMPGLNGFEVLRSIRTKYETPVLFLSARHEDADKIRGLGLGADDYIVKNASPAEIVARVKAVMRRAGGATSAANAGVLTFGDITIDIKAHEVRRGGDVITLTAREYELLELLATHPRQVLTRDTIFERLWGPYGDRHSLTVHIGRLREKLEVDAADPKLIVTVWGVGYRFEGAQ